MKIGPTFTICTGTLLFHSVAIWTFTFHEKSGCVLLIWKVNFKPTYRPNSSTFWSGNSDLLYSFFFLFFAEVVKFSAFCCHSKMVNTRESHFASNLNSNISTLWHSNDSVQKVLDLTNPAKK